MTKQKAIPAPGSKTVKWFIIILLSITFLSPASAQKGGRVRENFDFDWKFKLDSSRSAMQPAFDDSSWETIQLPHDWSIKLNFDQKAGGSAGYLPGGIGEYRKNFRIPASFKGKRISIMFDGVYHQAEVWLNGQKLFFHPYGYTGFEVDLTSAIIPDGQNVLAVRVDHSDSPSSRWYSGSGIYRHAWLQAVDPVHIVTWGTYITTPLVKTEKADVTIVTSVRNDSTMPRTIRISNRILDAGNKEIAHVKDQQVTIPVRGQLDIKQSLQVMNPVTWNIDKPVLYYCETTVKSGSRIIDTYRTPFGIRTFKFDKDKGFFLNGTHIKLQGVCLHQDAGSLGTALPDREIEHRLEILKEYGCNAIRCSHNPPAPEFLDMCDRMGFIVIDEAFDKWKSGYYSKYFDEWWQRDLEDMVLRDRNHPSVFLWSIGNELQEAWGDPEGVARAGMLQGFVHRTEPTRPVMLALQNRGTKEFAGVTDVIGYNYLEPRMLEDHKLFPDRIFLVSEGLPYYGSVDPGRLRSYTPVNPWNVVAANDFIQGEFIWVGADYLGEASWPAKGWPGGLFDLCMFEKPRAAYHRAVWNPKPMVSIAVADQSLNIAPARDLWQWPNLAAHWNFPQYDDGRMVEVRTTTNCETVELIVNGGSMGLRKTADYTNNTIIWFVPYKAGTVEAKAFNGGREVAVSKLVTSGPADHFTATADRRELLADGQDLSHITIQVFDSGNNPVQTDDRKVTVTVEGEGRFLGIDNGEIRRENSFAGNALQTYFGKALAIVQSTRKAGSMRVRIDMEGIKEPLFVEIKSK